MPAPNLANQYQILNIPLMPLPAENSIKYAFMFWPCIRIGYSTIMTVSEYVFLSAHLAMQTSLKTRSPIAQHVHIVALSEQKYKLHLFL